MKVIVLKQSDGGVNVVVSGFLAAILFVNYRLLCDYAEIRIIVMDKSREASRFSVERCELHAADAQRKAGNFDSCLSCGAYWP